MPTFEITSPDGVKYRVDGPEGATEQDALAQVQQAHQANAEIGENRASAVSALRGIPILGAYTDKAAAAINAAAQPVIGSPGMSQASSFGERYSENLPKITAGGNQFEQQHPIASTVGQVGLGVGTLAPIGATALGARALGLGGTTVTGMAARGAASGAALGAADTAARGGDVGTGAGVGALLGAAAPVAGRAIGAVLSPGASAQSAERQAAVAALRAEGVQPSAGQATGSKAIQYVENELGGAANRTAQERTAEQFTGATLRRAGVDAPRATPDVIDNAYTRIGNQFEGLAQRNNLTVDRQLTQDLRDAITDYHSIVAPPNRAPIIQNVMDEIVGHASTGRPIAGDAFQSLTSRIERAARASQGAPEVAIALRNMRGALNDAMERSIAHSGNAADLGAWRTARNQYRNMLVIERAATGAGSDAALGLISPAQLRNATVNQNRRAYARGTGDFAELARSGAAVMQPLPQSGTAPRAAARAIPMMLAGAAAHGLAGLPGIAFGAAAPFITGRLAMSRLGQSYLGNQLTNQLPLGGILGLGSRALVPVANERRS